MLLDHEDPSDAERRARWDAFLKKTEQGYALKRDLHYRDNFRKALETGKSAPVPEFLWPMLSDMTVPTLVIRGRESNMFEAATLAKVKEFNPRAATVELSGGHDLPGENADGLARAIIQFLSVSRL